MQKKILIVAPYTTFTSEGLPNRFSSLAKELSSRGHIVELVTSDFVHRRKVKRSLDTIDKQIYKVSLIETPMYKKNFGLARFYSIYRFSQRFKKQYTRFEAYDLVYASYPMIGPCNHIAKNSDHTSFIVDIQDLWPEAIWKNFRFFRFLKPLFYPFEIIKENIFKKSNYVFSVSLTYLNQYSKYISDEKKGVYYLGSDLNIVEKYKLPSPIKLYYFGTISFSYDIETICAAVALLRGDGMKIEIHIYGDGPGREALEKKNFDGAYFYGFVPYDRLEQYIGEMHVAVNAIKHDAPQSITNKLSDYLFIGSPIINSQKSEEIDEILASKSVINYRAGDVENLAKLLSLPHNQRVLTNKWYPDERFSRVRQISKICDFLERKI